MHSDTVSDSVDWLRSEYVRRRKRNGSYSLRAFAKHLGISVGPLSEIFAGRRPLTHKNALRIADRLGLSLAQRQRFLKPFEHGSERKRFSRALRGELASQRRLRELDEDAFQTVAEWPHYALLSLMETRGFRLDPRWIGRRLGLSPVEVQVILERLIRLGLVVESERGLVPGQDWVTSTHDVPSGALKQAHRQMLEKATASLDDVPVEARDITYVTMAIDPSRIPLAKKLIKQFRRSMVEVLETGDQTDVYNLNIQLIPLTRIDCKGENHG